MGNKSNFYLEHEKKIKANKRLKLSSRWIPELGLEKISQKRKKYLRIYSLNFPTLKLHAE